MQWSLQSSSSLFQLSEYVNASLGEGEKVLVCQPNTYVQGATYALYDAIGASKAVFGNSPVYYAKGVKNEVSYHLQMYYYYYPNYRPTSYDVNGVLARSLSFIAISTYAFRLSLRV